MAKKKLLVARKFPDDVLARCGRDYDCRFNPEDATWQGEDLVKFADGMDAVLLSSRNKVTADVAKAMPESVKIVATFSVGYEHIDVPACRARGIVVTNTPDVLTEATADVGLLLLLAASRRAKEGLQMVTTGQWFGWTPTQLLGRQAGGHILGVLGMGRIGRALAKRARALGMTIHYHNRRPLADGLAEGAVYHETAESLLKVSEFLSIHCELTPETNKLLDERRIAMLPKGAIVVNTARGGVIDDDAMIAALKSGQVAAAGLDVFNNEPKVHPGYFDLPNAFVLPHIGSATIETRNAMGFRALDNIDAFFAGKEPLDSLGG